MANKPELDEEKYLTTLNIIKNPDVHNNLVEGAFIRFQKHDITPEQYAEIHPIIIRELNSENVSPQAIELMTNFVGSDNSGASIAQIDEVLEVLQTRDKELSEELNTSKPELDDATHQTFIETLRNPNADQSSINAVFKSYEDFSISESQFNDIYPLAIKELEQELKALKETNIEDLTIGGNHNYNIETIPTIMEFFQEPDLPIDDHQMDSVKQMITTINQTAEQRIMDSIKQVITTAPESGSEPLKTLPTEDELREQWKQDKSNVQDLRDQFIQTLPPEQRDNVPDLYKDPTSNYPPGTVLGLYVDPIKEMEREKESLAKVKEFEKTLTPEQLEAWNTYKEAHQDFYGGGSMDLTLEDFTIDPKDSDVQDGLLSRADEIDGPRDYVRGLDTEDVKDIQRLIGANDDGLFGQESMAKLREYLEQKGLPSTLEFAELRQHAEEEKTGYRHVLAPVNGDTYDQTIADKYAQSAWQRTPGDLAMNFQESAQSPPSPPQDLDLNIQIQPTQGHSPTVA